MAWGKFDIFCLGGVYFLLLTLEKYLIKPERRPTAIRILWQIATMLFVIFEWVIFSSNDISSGITYCIAMIGGYGFRLRIDPKMIFYLRQYGFYLLVGVISATPLMKKICDFLEKKAVGAAVLTTCYGGLFLWAVSYLILGAHNPFIYFNF